MATPSGRSSRAGRMRRSSLTCIGFWRRLPPLLAKRQWREAMTERDRRRLKRRCAPSWSRESTRARTIPGLTRKAGLHPQLVAVDDLQWADPSSLALLRYVARNVKNHRLLLVGAYRVEEAGLRPHLREALAKMDQEGVPAGLLVPGLPRPEMRRLADVFLGPHALPGDFLELLWHETQGYPLFIREVLRGLEGEGVIDVRGAAKRLVR